ncbi:rRNA methylase [Rubidibacter lacunae KORDI 51-2]|uniref:tRNA (guanosine(18)-2'-O)-methyltransferase n=1 Tax=Rubidibacter lacunae KORDI 51-2 TaxID=582515 RepID=U5D5M0_9CHRO|nr:tRNA (guanosine(18)-2'-O)-methyltransferase TrmH [Rubidibacter lacunae]ERN39968.1 rRNA methylase [Rubidibacter lacunae KORDI 51-2]
MLPRRYHKLVRVLEQRQPDLTVLLESVHKPHNLAAILRTCDAVGVLEAFAVHHNPEEILPFFSGTALGSEKWVFLHALPDIDTAIGSLQQRGFRVYAAHLSERAIAYDSVDFTQPSAILLGAEKWGVSDRALELVDAQIAIPMVGMVQSLNVSVAAATILFEARRQRQAAGLYDRVRLEPETYRRLLFEWSYPKLAAQVRERGESYPPLGEDGEILV